MRTGHLVCLLLTGIQVSQFHLELCCSLFVSSNEVRVVPPHTLQHPLLNHLGLLQATFVLSRVSPTLQYADNMLHVQHENVVDNVAGQLPFQHAHGNQALLAALQNSETWALVLLLLLTNSLR